MVAGCNKDMSFKSVWVAGDFINGTTAVGLLVIVYSTNKADLDTHYTSMIALRQPSLQITLSGLYSDHFYNVSLFVIDENGLPFHKAATQSRVVHFMPTTNTLCGNTLCFTCLCSYI